MVLAIALVVALGRAAAVNAGASFEIDRVWEKTYADSSLNAGYVLATVTNHGPERLRPYVAKVECTALDQRGKRININFRSNQRAVAVGDFFTVKIPIELEGREMLGASCRLRGVEVVEPRVPDQEASDDSSAEDELAEMRRQLGLR